MLFALISAVAITLLAMFAFDVLRVGPGAGRFGMAIDRGRLEEVAETIRDKMRRD
jgi:hypothetical protein